MTKNETEFSKYATSFYKIIEGEKSGKAEFVKMLLKMGLLDNGKKIIDELFPTETTSKGKTIIKREASDRLRKFLHGTNDISEIADEVYAALDHDNYGAYIEALEDYEDLKLIKFAQALELDTDIKDINKVRYDIAAYYYSIIEKASTKNYSEPGKTNDCKDVVFSYTLEEPEKKALVKLCELTDKALCDLKKLTDKISDKRHELKNLTDSAEDQNWKSYLIDDIDSLKESFDEDYPKLEKLCTKLIRLLEPKTDMDEEFLKLISFANNIGNDEYKITCPDEFKYNAFNLMISNFKECIKRTLRVIDKL